MILIPDYQKTKVKAVKFFIRFMVYRPTIVIQPSSSYYVDNENYIRVYRKKNFATVKQSWVLAKMYARKDSIDPKRSILSVVVIEGSKACNELFKED